MALEKIGRRLVLLFMALLPWSVIISVFGSEELHIGLFRFWKEAVLASILIVFLLDTYRKKIQYSYDLLDIFIVLYILWLVGVSFFQQVPVVGYVYGLRYDAEFFLAFLFFRRMFPHWRISFGEITRYFLISGGLMLFAGFLIRFVFGEMILTLVGFSDHVSVWDGVGSAPPIYHGIPGASVVRFQGVLEGPNQMAFFLLIYMGIYASVFLKMKKYRFINGIVFALLLFLLMLTYSRSGYIGAIVGGLIAWSLSFIQHWYQKKKIFSFSLKKIISAGIVGVLIAFILVFQFGTHPTEIFGRHASTSGHFERMYIGLLRFKEDPLGSGLASSGPASRSRFEVNEKPSTIPDDSRIQSVTKKLKARNEDFIYTSETYYIPESWYIQQLVEGGIVGLFLFISILFMTAWKVRKYTYVLGAFVGILVINIFLHSFESMHSSLLVFIFLALLAPLDNESALGK